MARSGEADTLLREDGPAEQPLSAVRLPAELIDRIDTWAGQNAVTRADAICKLVELGLAKKSRRTNGLQSARAAVLAGQQLDQMGDASATTQERADRKQRLTEGPLSFREVRRDRKKRAPSE